MNYAVIGANYGDEGKGLITDYLAWKSRADVVVRFNGGAQAGHTVQVVAGWHRAGTSRHIFHHVGSGSFLGLPTFLGPQFISNPMLLVRELKQLKIEPLIFADPRGLVTSPWEMLYNQIVEEIRGGSKHGSCGVGIGATVQSSDDKIGLTVESLLRQDLPERLEALRQAIVEKLSDPLSKANKKYALLTTDFERITDGFLGEVEQFNRLVTCQDTSLLKGKRLIFEGAQGLALDQNSSDFPYVTRSNTGLKNVIEICQEIDAPDLTPVYVTRSYLTRHGEGPLPGADPNLLYFDDTNLTNPYQGSLRFAEFTAQSAKATCDRVLADLEQLPKHLYDESMIAITHLDQASSTDHTRSFKHLCDRVLTSHGPTRHDVRLLRNKRMAY